MYIVMTEEQKNVIFKHGNMMVVKIKWLISRIIEVMERMTARIRQCAGTFKKFRDAFWRLPPIEKHKIVRRWSKCGFNEKEINMIVFGMYNCRDNC